VSFRVDEDRWLRCTVLDLKAERTLFADRPVVRLL